MSTFVDRARGVVRRPPRAIARRLVEIAATRLRRPWSSLYPRMVSGQSVAAAAGAASVDAMWEAQLRAPFFVSPSTRAQTIRIFAARYPDAARSIVDAAERALRHEFDLLGSGPARLGTRLPWHVDFKTGREWPRQYAPDIEFAELDRPTDVKVPWELSRAQHFTTLGEAYWLTGDERYAADYAAQVIDWIAENPWGYGVNWICAMDVALRAISWIWGFYFMGGSAACGSAAFRGEFLRALYLHGEYIATHIERADVNGNHYLCDGVGLVFLGAFFQRTRKGRAWLAAGRQIIEEEIFNQTSADGVHFEASIAYHRLVLEAFLTSGLLLERHGERLPETWTSRLERMLEFVDAYTKPDGSTPLIGDADDGRIQKLGRQPIGDHRYLLAIGAVLFDRADFKRTATRFCEEAFWLLGDDGARTFDALPDSGSEPASKAFADGGYYVLRSTRAHVIVDCAEVGMRGRGGHGHNDITSFELWLDGVNLVTDSGAYVYTASPEWRNRFRSTAFHNVLQVDGEELNRFIAPDNLWQLRADAYPRDAAWWQESDVDCFRCGHTGYDRLSPPVAVTRELRLLKSEPVLLLRDAVDGDGERDVSWRIHLDPHVEATLHGRDVRLAVRNDELWLQLELPAAFELAIDGGWTSPSYGVRVASQVVVARGRVALPMRLSARFSARRVQAFAANLPGMTCASS